MTEIEDEEEIKKILGQFRLNLNQLLKPLRLYGQGVYVDGVTLEIESLAWQLHWKLCGVDIPYETNDIHW